MNRPKKKRLDLLLQELYPDLSRSRLQAEIMAGRVYVNGLRSDKPGTLIDQASDIKINEPENPYVSRGGLKLEGALKSFSADVTGLTILDVGASTGGFTDCLLQKGAKKVYALDVGYGQLDLKLRQDPRVVVMERFNVRNLKPEDLPHIPDIAVIDVSFISLSIVIPVLKAFKIPRIIALVKPQFEVGRADADKGGGVIRDPALHIRVLEKSIKEAAENDYYCAGITYSPKPGPRGNLEYFIDLQAKRSINSSDLPDYKKLIEEVVKTAHLNLSAAKKSE